MFLPATSLIHRLMPSPEESLEVRLFQQICLASSLLALLIVLPMNLFLGIAPQVDVSVAGFGVLAIGLWRTSRRGHHHPILLLVSYLAALNVGWFASGGSIGSTGLFAYPAALILVVFLHGWKRSLGMALFALDGVMLLVVEFLRPQSIIPFISPFQRLMDVSSGFLVSTAACALAIWIVIDDFRRERRRLRRALEQLEQSTQEQLRSEAEKRQLEIQVEHLQRVESLGRLAGGVAHDMNNVLAAIMSVGEVMKARSVRHPDLAPEMAMEAERILQASRRGRNLVAGLLDFARKGLGERSHVDINQLLRQEADLMASTTLRRLKVVLDLQEDVPMVLGDPNAIANAIMNLCVNAAEAMPQGGTLTLHSRCEDRATVQILICDTGLGMEPEVLSRALEPFYSTKHQEKGTGLGLSIVMGIIEAHHGSIEIKSRLGEGTCVQLNLPAQEPPLEASSSPSLHAEPFTARKILLVDDDEIVRETAMAMLETLGHAVIPCSGGRSALRRIQEGIEVDLVILDMNMPGMGGEETLRHMRELRPELKVLIATGYTDADVKTLVARDPNLELITKPYSMDEIQQFLDGL